MVFLAFVFTALQPTKYAQKYTRQPANAVVWFFYISTAAMAGHAVLEAPVTGASKFSSNEKFFFLGTASATVGCCWYMNNTYSVLLGHTVAHGSARALTVEQRKRHLYAIGRTGVGKSTFIRSLMQQDILAGRGCTLIDPHGDIAQSIADCIPQHRVKDVIYFDTGDFEHPIGFNILEFQRPSEDYPQLSREQESDLIAAEAVSMFKGIFRESWGPWLEYLLKTTVLTLLLQEDQYTPITLASVKRMLDDTRYRGRIVGSLRDPVLSDFWRKYFPKKLSARQEIDLTSSTLNKVGKFASSPILRNIVAQPTSGFSLRDVMDEKKILIVNLAKGRIGEDNANYLGSLIVSKVVSTALRRAFIPEEERVPHHLYVDEFQNVTTKDFASIVSEARKYALTLCIAHQNFTQVDPLVVDSIIKDVGTLIAFKVGFEDNDRLAKAFRPISNTSLESTTDGQFYLRTGAEEPKLLQGIHPDILDVGRAHHSLERIKRATWRHQCTPRKKAEEAFKRWYRYQPRDR